MKILPELSGSAVRRALLTALAGALAISAASASPLSLSTLLIYNGDRWAELNANDSGTSFSDDSGLDSAAALNVQPQYCVIESHCAIDTSGSGYSAFYQALDSTPSMDVVSVAGLESRDYTDAAVVWQTLASSAPLQGAANVYELAALYPSTGVQIVTGSGAASFAAVVERRVALTPEPSTLILFGSALFAGGLYRRRTLACVSISAGNKRTSDTRSDTPQRPTR